jgi:hypothetical protein
MFALWRMGRYGDILGQNHKILLKNRQIHVLEKMYNQFICNRILNPSEYSYDKYHRLSFLMSQAWLVILGQKPQIFDEYLLNCYL